MFLAFQWGSFSLATGVEAPQCWVNIKCASSVSLPGVLVGDGAAVGALRLVKVSYDAFGIYAEAPARKVGGRKCDVLALEHVFLATRRGQS